MWDLEVVFIDQRGCFCLQKPMWSRCSTIVRHVGRIMAVVEIHPTSIELLWPVMKVCMGTK